VANWVIQDLNTGHAVVMGVLMEKYNSLSPPTLPYHGRGPEIATTRGSDSVTRMIDDYEYLWNRTDSNWVLLRVPHSDRYCIFNKLGSVLLIEDDAMASEICTRMKNAGCDILETIPEMGPAVPITKPETQN
jgi:hypothetical protein